MTLQPFSRQLRCRACEEAIESFLALGELPLANALAPLDRPGAEQERFPLTMARCPRCALVQLAESINPHRLFDTYNYLSSTSPAFVAHARRLTERLVRERSLGASSRIVEIASNDGYLLQHYRARGVPVLGIEPAANIAQIAREAGIETRAEYFSPDLAARLRDEGHAADVVHANNVLAHMPDLRGVAAGIATLLKDDGVAVIEVPYLGDLLDRVAFDTVYHEHLCYFALTPLVPLLAEEGLTIVDVERLSIHGGSLRIFAGHGGVPSERVGGLLAEEAAWGVADRAVYERFADRVRAFPSTLQDFLGTVHDEGSSIAAYGAAAKGATLLNYCEIGRELVDFVVDRSPMKQGQAMPGVEIPIFAPDELARRRPDHLLVLAWNFADEIMEQQREYSRAGGTFVLPLPEPRIVEAPA
jgi:SAM-dependent methyltransferase